MDHLPGSVQHTRGSEKVLELFRAQECAL